jgi:hypothetical protein
MSNIIDILLSSIGRFSSLKLNQNIILMVLAKKEYGHSTRLEGHLGTNTILNTPRTNKK